MKKSLFVLFFLVSSMSMMAQNMDEDMKKFFIVSGTEASFKNIIPVMIENLKQNQAFSTIPEEFWTEFAKEAETSYKVLEEQIGEVYKKHFTSAEIKQLIAFYESPIGKKLVSEQPQIQTESYQLGTEWGRQLGEKVVKKIQEKKD